MKINGISSAVPTVLPAAERREAERSEGSRSGAAGKTVPPDPPAPPRPDPEVVDAKRRTFTAGKTSANVLTVLHEERFQDRSPATLLDEGQYLFSIRTMYRILEQGGESLERRDQLIHPAYQKPELLATAPNQLWSWDITKLRGPVKWTSFFLYVILDIFSRYVAGWMVAPRESAETGQAIHLSPPVQ